MVSLQIKEIISNTIELFKFILFFIGGMLIWSYIPWLAIILLIIISTILVYEAYKFFKEMHQSNLDDIQEQLNIVQDSWIEEISNEVRNNWDLNSIKVVPYNSWDCRIYIQQDEGGNVIDTEIQECSIRNKRKANRLKKSLVKAVLKTSPLPQPEDETVFARQIYFDFNAS